MTADELRAIMIWLQDRVTLGPKESGKPVDILFDAPTAQEMVAAGLNAAGSKRLLSMPWWDEMIEDIVDTPAMCEPDELPDQVLSYGKDVVAEYIRKRFPLEPAD